ncbi:MAG TPA: DNA recombination/repair protein RecA, partial [Ignavibacteriaceae bacterium]|nr:DNA recombination/repair protein RecA [Ignavibacteriaceae bacterium]
INQLRSKIGVMFGNPETTTGGNALKFYASVRIDIRRIAAIKEGEEVVGNRTKVKIVKSKVAPPFKQTEIDILYNEGISKTGDVLDLATELGIIKKGGAWFTYGEERIQGREQFRQKLIEFPEMYKNIERDIKQKLGILKEPAAAQVEEKTEEKTKSKKK